MPKTNNLSGLQPEALCTFAQAAEILNVDASFIPMLIRAGKLQFVQIGSRKRIPRWALRAYEEGEIKRAVDTVLHTLNIIRNSTGA